METKMGNSRCIYAYTTEQNLNESKDYLRVKIGDTTRSGDERTKEQQTGLSSRQIILNPQGDFDSRAWVWNGLKVIKGDGDVHNHKSLKKFRLSAANCGDEWFSIPVPSDKTPQEKLVYVWDLIDSVIADLEGHKVRPPVIFREKQADRMARAMIARKQGKTEGIGFLCPRFGKTLFALGLFNELSAMYGGQVMLLPAYWLSVFSSFKDECHSYDDFQDIIFLNSADENVEEIAKIALLEGKRVCICISLHGKMIDGIEEEDQSTWVKRHQWIQQIADSEKFMFADEGDWGTHAEKQVKKLEFLFNGKSTPMMKLFASGSNVGRLARCTKKSQFVLSIPYHELEKSDPSIIIRRCYKLTVSDDLIATIEVLDENNRPSFTKVWDRPEQNKKFITQLVQSLIGYHPERPMVLSSFTDDHITCFQMWISADLTPMEKIEKIVKEALPDWHVVVINGSKTTGKFAEDYAKKEIEIARREGKVGVLFICSIMTARSWSVSEVQCTVFAYDKGSMDSATQKGSRPLTPGKTFDGDKKVYGHIVDLGFDTNRSEKVEGIILTDALAKMQADDIDFPTALRYVTKCINAFTVNEYGYPVAVDPDEMFATLSNEDVILRIANASSFDDSKLFEIAALIGNIKGNDKSTKEKIKAIVGKVKNSVRVDGGKNKTPKTDKEKKELLALLNKARQVLNQSATSVVYLAKSYDLTTYRSAVELIAKNKAKSAEFLEFFGVSATDVVKLLDFGFLPEMMLDLIVEGTCRAVPSMSLFR